MILTKNVCIGGTWYGPAHGNAEMTHSEYAELIASANGGGAAAFQFRERVVAAMARLVDSEVMPKLSDLTDAERAEAFSMSEDDMVAKFAADGSLLSGRTTQLDEHNLDPAERIVIGPGRYIERQDLVALLDLIESPEAAADPVATMETVPAAIAEASADDTPTTFTVDPPAAPAVPKGKVEEILAWVNGGQPGDTPTDGWQDRARAAIAAELADPPPRKTLVEPLQLALDHDENEVT